MARTNEGIHIGGTGKVIIRPAGDWGRIGQNTGLARRNMPDREEHPDLPSFSEIRSSLPKRAIAYDAFVVGDGACVWVDDKAYVLLLPRIRVKEGHVYVPIN
jgi:hypothetical protein